MFDGCAVRISNLDAELPVSGTVTTKLDALGRTVESSDSQAGNTTTIERNARGFATTFTTQYEGTGLSSSSGSSFLTLTLAGEESSSSNRVDVFFSPYCISHSTIR